MSGKKKKAKNKTITIEYLKNRTKMLTDIGFPKTKWIYFCEEMLRLGFTVELYEARQTYSKYITVRRQNDWSKSFKVRFSDHKPIRHREMAGDCDFFVGVTHTGVRTTHNAVNAVCNFFNVQRIKGLDNPPTNEGYVLDFILQ